MKNILFEIQFPEPDEFYIGLAVNRGFDDIGEHISVIFGFLLFSINILFYCYND